MHISPLGRGLSVKVTGLLNASTALARRVRAGKSRKANQSTLELLWQCKTRVSGKMLLVSWGEKHIHGGKSIAKGVLDVVTRPRCRKPLLPVFCLCQVVDQAHCAACTTVSLSHGQEAGVHDP